MTVNVAVIRKMIDIPNEGGSTELGDDTINEYISQATVFVTNVANPGAPLDMVDLAIKHLAAYWSYETYSDRHHHEVIGSFDDSANWTPQLQRAWERDTREKLAAMERRFQMTLEQIGGRVKSVPVFSSIR